MSKLVTVLTNFGLGFGVHDEAIGNAANSTRRVHVTNKRLSRLESLHGEIFAHRLRDGVTVFAGLDTLLGEVFDLGAARER